MDKHYTKKLMANWPKWMQDYRLTSNSPKKTGEPIQKPQENNKKVLAPS
jgi:hypothetical protein